MKCQSLLNLPGCLDDTDCYLPSIGNQERLELFHFHKLSSGRCLTGGRQVSARNEQDDQGPVFMNKIRPRRHETSPSDMVPDAGPEISVGGEHLSPTKSRSFPAASSLDEPHEPTCVIALG